MIKIFYGEKCIYNNECKSGLFCDLEDKIFQPQRICRCSEDLSWNQDQCVKEGRVIVNHRHIVWEESLSKTKCSVIGTMFF